MSESYDVLSKTGFSKEGVEKFGDKTVTHEDETATKVSGLSHQSYCIDTYKFVHQSR
jgi:hypothetical protein